jgi:hypothetical protein
MESLFKSATLGEEKEPIPGSTFAQDSCAEILPVEITKARKIKNFFCLNKIAIQFLIFKIQILLS